MVGQNGGIFGVSEVFSCLTSRARISKFRLYVCQKEPSIFARSVRFSAILLMLLATINHEEHQKDGRLSSEIINRDFCVYWFPHDQNLFISSHEFWWRELDFERLARVGARKYFVGWHKVEGFGAPTHVRSEVYVSFPDAWMELEPSYILNVPWPDMLSNFSNRILSGTTARVQEVWRVARSEQTVPYSCIFLQLVEMASPNVAQPIRISKIVPGCHFSYFAAPRQLIQ